MYGWATNRCITVRDVKMQKLPGVSQKSIQSLFIEMRFQGQSLAKGTAFIVNSRIGPLLITNRHNVTGRHQDTNQPLSPHGGVPNEIVVTHNHASPGHWIKTVEPLLDGEKPRWIEHPTFGPKADFVALPLTRLEDARLYPYDYSSTESDIKIGPTEIVSVIGFPFGMSGGGSLAIWATGFIASEPEIDIDGLPIILIDCRTRKGQSGSPVVAYRSGGAVAGPGGGVKLFHRPVSRFIGIYSGRINKDSDLGRVWKASAIAELVQSI